MYFIRGRPSLCSAIVIRGYATSTPRNRLGTTLSLDHVRLRMHMRQLGLVIGMLVLIRITSSSYAHAPYLSTVLS
ncbi:hypothetical protein GGR53DRAFT_40842 [Hypoxylon sp. FL1150]|nr:hypothetical protein GGR53DRAFT_40842 [Hypoxylon sp. FL1150]